MVAAGKCKVQSPNIGKRIVIFDLLAPKQGALYLDSAFHFRGSKRVEKAAEGTVSR